MCGIAGIFSPQGVDRDALVRMTHLVTHRGPDAFGFAYCDSDNAAIEIIHDQNHPPRLKNSSLGLGNRRLAILDLSAAGHMPMLSGDGQCCVTHNGEIYNYKEIRAELRSRGHHFRTQTDTEVILEAYLEWGELCLERFNGMWSFALWDARKRKLFCARDRFGVKPFYYSLYNGSLYLGSEIKQLLEAAKMPRTANPDAVYHFLDRGLTDYSAQTLFENVLQLPAAHCLAAALGPGGSIQLQTWRYWKIRSADRPQSHLDAVGEFRDKFTSAVSLRLRSDVPIGASLSGGVDSSSVVCEAAKRSSSRGSLRTFSACFDDPQFDEHEYISAVVESVGSDPHLTYPSKETFWQTLEKLIYHHDEPVASSNVFAQWCVMAEAKRSATPVILGGQGADEILCGYQKYRYVYLWHLLKTADSRLPREVALSFRNGTRSCWTLADAGNYLPARFRSSLSLPQRVGSYELRQKKSQLAFAYGAGSSLQDRQTTDVLHSSLPALLHFEDRNSMAHSVESRLPFLDYRLAEFCLNCASSLKIRDGWSKWILREALSGTLPDRVRLRRTKLGFDTPQSLWLSYGLQNGHREAWDTTQLKMARFLSQPHLAAEVRQFLAGKNGALPPNALFRAVSLEIWARVFNVS